MKPGTDYLLTYSSEVAEGERRKRKSCNLRFYVANPADEQNYKICFKEHSFRSIFRGARISWSWNEKLFKLSHHDHSNSYYEKYYDRYEGPEVIKCLQVGQKLLFKFFTIGSPSWEDGVNGTGKVTLRHAIPEETDSEETDSEENDSDEIDFSLEKNSNSGMRKSEVHHFSAVSGCSKTIDMKPDMDYLLSHNKSSEIDKLQGEDFSVGRCQFQFIIANATVRLRYKICFRKHSFSMLWREAKVKWFWNKFSYTEVSFRPVSQVEQCLDIGDVLTFQYSDDKMGTAVGTANVSLTPATVERGRVFQLPSYYCSSSDPAGLLPFGSVCYCLDKRVIPSSEGTIYSDPAYLAGNGINRCSLQLFPIYQTIDNGKPNTFCYTFHYSKSLSTRKGDRLHRIIFELHHENGAPAVRETAYSGVVDGSIPRWIQKEICVHIGNQAETDPYDYWNKVVVKLRMDGDDGRYKVSDYPEFVILYTFKYMENLDSDSSNIAVGLGISGTLSVVLSVLICCICCWCCRKKAASQQSQSHHGESGDAASESSYNPRQEDSPLPDPGQPTYSDLLQRDTATPSSSSYSSYSSVDSSIEEQEPMMVETIDHGVRRHHGVEPSAPPEELPEDSGIPPQELPREQLPPPAYSDLPRDLVPPAPSNERPTIRGDSGRSQGEAPPPTYSELFPDRG